jgi:2-polyprenyl-3-methyl-5-hydroxy-6-metoxy-1,4-benzoquinol methylase
MPAFAYRSTQKEIMDDLAFGGTEMDQALHELEFINQWLGGNQLTTNGLQQIVKKNPVMNGALTIADLGCGSGDMLRMVARWGRKLQVPLQLTGIDANAYILDVASQKSKAYPEIAYEQLNIFSEEFKNIQWDVIMATLFTHHFNDKELISLLTGLKKQARKAILINDLHRHPLAYHSIAWLTALFSKSYMVKNDAKLSVLRSFSRADWQRILQAAGITNYSIKWCWAFRWKVIIWT